MRFRTLRGFTLVEILIVVVILGILAAIVTPQFANATEQAQKTAMADQIAKIRRSIAIYTIRNDSLKPNITAGVGTWGALIAPGSPYMRQAPVNSWVNGPNSKTIIIGTAADASFLTTHGWIYDPATGNLWAAGFDANDEPYARP